MMVDVYGRPSVVVHGTSPNSARLSAVWNLEHAWPWCYLVQLKGLAPNLTLSLTEMFRFCE